MKIVICGDIALCKGVESMILEGKGDSLAKGLRTKFHKADLFLANVECPLTDSEKPQWDHFPTLKAKRKAGSFLKDLGVNIASLANNHIADYGINGLKDTISVLEEQGIKWCGAGWTPEEAIRPLIVKKKDHTIGILALAQPEISAAKNGRWGAGLLKDTVAIEKIRELSNKVDITIAYFHYGVEFFNYPTPHQVRLSRSLIDAGANLVIGHHPHVPQGYEYYKDGFIAYSLGNFIFDMSKGPHLFSRLGLIVEADIEKNAFNHINIIPVDTYGGNPKVLEGEQKSNALEYINYLSATLKDKKQLKRKYYFTCRDNLHIHIKALINYGIQKRNILKIKDLIFSQFWPQLLELRLDLIRFLLSGNALNYEKEKGRPSEGIAAYIWRAICIFSWLMGLNWILR